MTAGYYRRDFYNLQVTDNQNLAASDWTPVQRSPRRPTRGCRSSGQPIPMYTLNAGKVGVATDNLVTYSTQNKTTYNGVEFTRQRARATSSSLFGGVTTDRARRTATVDTDGCDVARDNPNGAALLRLGRRRSARRSRRRPPTRSRTTSS